MIWPLLLPDKQQKKSTKSRHHCILVLLLYTNSRNSIVLLWKLSMQKTIDFPFWSILNSRNSIKSHKRKETGMPPIFTVMRDFPVLMKECTTKFVHKFKPWAVFAGVLTLLLSFWFLGLRISLLLDEKLVLLLYNLVWSLSKTLNIYWNRRMPFKNMACLQQKKSDSFPMYEKTLLF